MILVYASRTKNIARIVEKLSLPESQLLDISCGSKEVLKDKFCILTYTDYLGQIPETVSSFLSLNKENLIAVAGSGNRNFGENFCGAARKIHLQYNVPLIATFELSGDDESIGIFRERLIKENFEK